MPKPKRTATPSSARTRPHPPIATPAAWRQARVKLLAQEKAETKFHDRVSAQRRRLPMVKLEKDYVFTGPKGKTSLRDLFAGRTQLIVYHFMFDPAWTKGCMGCTGFVDALGSLEMLHERDTSFALVSRAPLPKLTAYKKKRGWDHLWVSSHGSDFNYDFHVTIDEKVTPGEYNYITNAEHRAKGEDYFTGGESHGLSVFFRLGDDLYHTYSAYARGVERLSDAYALLDVTPYGRQEDWEDSPQGWPQRLTYG